MRIPLQFVLLLATAFLPSSEAGQFTSYIGCFSSSVLTTAPSSSSLVQRVAGNKLAGFTTDACALTASATSPYIFIYPDANSQTVVACGAGCGFFNSSLVAKVDDSFCKSLTSKDSEACGGRYSGSMIYIAAYKNTKFSTMSSYTVPQSVSDQCFMDNQFCGSESISCGANGVCSASKQCQYPAANTGGTGGKTPSTNTLPVRTSMCASGKNCTSGVCANEICVNSAYIGCYLAPNTAWARSTGTAKGLSLGSIFCNAHPYMSLYNPGSVACGCGIFAKGVRVADSKCDTIINTGTIGTTGPAGSSDVSSGIYFSVYENKAKYTTDTNNDCFYTDVNNCGAPGIKCASGGVCTNGACSGGTIQPPPLPVPTPPCAYTKTASGKCLNTQGDAKNCGSENNTCGTDESCVNGKCTNTEKNSASCAKNSPLFDQPPKACPDSKPNCVQGTCTDFQTDPKNCGGVNGLCLDPYFNCVKGKCTSILTDPDNCNGNVKCDDGFACVNGACKDRSSDDYVPSVCDSWEDCIPNDYTIECRKGQCVNPSNHPNNCGISQAMCRGPNAKCIKGLCVNPVTIPLPTFNASSNDPKNCGYPGLECPATYKCIQGICTDVNKNPNFCGTGINTVACANGQFCVNGTCVSNDPGYCARCSPSFICVQKSSCTSPLTDDRNCGKENAVCPPGTKCSGGNCVNLMEDPHHCGSLSKTCAIGLTCANGNCTDLTQDNYNCGRVGNVCKDKETCTKGFCNNIQIDHDNCGGHGNECDVNEKCDGGSCICVSPFAKAPGSSKCTDPKAPVTCGGTQCAPPFVCVDNNCLDPNTSDKYCGAKKAACQAGEFCEGGVCVPSNSATSCAPRNVVPKKDCTTLGMNACADGVCVDTNTDEKNCGAVNSPCTPPNDICKGGKCYNSNTSNEYCGALRMKCGDKSQCVIGECVCASTPTEFWMMKINESTNVGTCINVENDMNNCGKPDKLCVLDQIFPLSVARCEKGNCFDSSLDPGHCGSYDKVCADPTRDCAMGSCTNYKTDPNFCGSIKALQKCSGTRPACVERKCYDAYNSTDYCGTSTNGVKCLGSSTICDKGTCKCTNGNSYSPSAGCIDVNGSDNGNCGGVGVQCDAVAAKCVSTLANRCLPKCLKGQCTNVKEDSNNCGEANQLVCSGSTPNCANGKCVDMTTDNDNCGGPSNACPKGNTCIRGLCKDTTSDKDNCGRAGNSCGAAACAQSNCVCPDGKTFNVDAKTCVDLKTDPNNCGSLRNVCTTLNTLFCTNCIPECSNGNCYNPALDPDHCGNYATKCRDATPNCANKICVDFKTDDANCGSAGSSCNGKSCFNGTCTDITADPKNCGTTKLNVVDCSDPKSTCSSGICTCSGGLTWKEGKCFNFNDDPANCGGKGNRCDAQETCSNGKRIPLDCIVVSSKFPELWPAGTDCCTEKSTQGKNAIVTCENKRVTSIDINPNPAIPSKGFPDLTQLDKLKSLSLNGIVNGNIGDTICNSTNLISLTVKGTDCNGYLPSCLKSSALTNLDVGGSGISGTVPGWLCNIKTLTYWNGNDSSLTANGALDLYYSGTKNQPLYMTSKCCGTGANTCTDPQPDCLAKQTSCTNFKTDKANCGGEDLLCATTCSNGTCIDTATDSNNCGAVGNVCKDKAKCDGGSCKCTGGKEYIIDGCYDLKNDHDNCGAVKVNCGKSAKCDSGTCVCTANVKFMVKGDACFDTSITPEYCGSIGSTKNCTGTNQPNCAKGQCTNFDSDDANCGILGTVCKSSSKCQGGKCTCATDFTYVNELCLNLKSDPQNCGSVGKICDGMNPDCVQKDKIYDSPTCTNVNTDNKACGLSRKQCSDSQTCAGGNCIPNDCVVLAANFPSIWPVATDCCNVPVTVPAPGSVVVTCNSNGKVTDLNINSVPLSKDTTLNIASLKDLQTLNVVGSSLAWDVSKFCLLPKTSLKSLVLQSNAMSGTLPECSDRFTNLETLIISNNDAVSGVVPSFLCSLDNLKIWDGTSTNLTANGALGLSYNTAGDAQAPVLKNTDQCCGGTANPCLKDSLLPNCVTSGNKPTCVNFLTDEKNCGKKGISCAKGDCKGGSCLDFTTDPTNCGGLDKACDANSECSNSKCQCKSKDSKWVTIDQNCVDTSSDSSHCGKGQIKCDDNQKCTSGKCTCSDDSLKNNCVDNPNTGKCTDPSKDVAYCGVAGGTYQKCGPNMECSRGTCRCVAGFVANPGGVCTNPLNDSNYCGLPDANSFATCTPGVGACKKGKCGCSDNAVGNYAEAQDGSCHNTDTDAKFCGSSKKDCGAFAVCNSGSCQCGSTFAMKADGTCTDPNIDNEFCGANGLKCDTTTATCTNGACVCVPPFKKTDSKTTCVNFDSDMTNCGQAGFVCDAGTTTCVKGSCQCRPDMPNLTVLTSDRKKCVNPSVDPSYCGTKDKNQQCSDTNPHCVAGTCTNVKTDPSHCGTTPETSKPCTGSTPSCMEGKCIPKVCADLANAGITAWDAGVDCCTTPSSSPSVSLKCNDNKTPTSILITTGPDAFDLSLLCIKELTSITVTNTNLASPVIPDCICSSKSLTVLNLSNNNLGGSLPDCLAKLPLKDLQVQSNPKLGGNDVLPSWLCKITTLQNWNADGDGFQLNGGLPTVFSPTLSPPMNPILANNAKYCCGDAPNICDATTPNCDAKTKACFNFDGDSTNCGSKGNTCPSGTTCSAGTCQCPTDQKYSKEKQRCVKTQTDPENCGDVGNRCSLFDKPYCVNGQCDNSPSDVTPKCSAGTVYCSMAKQCIDYQNNPDHCGFFNNKCDTKYCSAGKCRDLDNDVWNCGSVGKACGPTFKCVNKRCVKDTTLTDISVCGSCEKLFPGGFAVCKKGKCYSSCPAYHIWDAKSKSCVDTNSDPKNCGVCGNVCGGSIPVCVRKFCYDLGAEDNCGFLNDDVFGSQCAAGTRCKVGSCVPNDD
ncbi:hypothetical protein HDU81_003842 [Chytriomyces hyalinus]|nr:hypothetical protein HDU81_003842 [Chytriomyces hyalinus]